MSYVTVGDLRRVGHKVRVMHWRIVGSKLRPVNEITPDMHDRLKSKGGKTRVEITTPDNQTLVGEAICDKNDPFNRKLGIRIAVGRALKPVNG